MFVDQEQNLERVSKRIAASIETFCRDVLTTMPHRFRMEDLLSHVRRDVGVIAPDSPSRILRQLRSKGQIDYVVVDRAASLYQLFPVQDQQS